jgi:hypothetical protein
MPRIRDWRFSSATSSGRPWKRGASDDRAAAKSGSIGTFSNRIPRFSASCRASASEPAEE